MLVAKLAPDCCYVKGRVPSVFSRNSVARSIYSQQSKTAQTLQRLLVKNELRIIGCVVSEDCRVS